MSAYETFRNYETRYCVFAVDSKNDLQILPTSKRSGTGEMSLNTPCRQGSLAKTPDGTIYALDGTDNWVISSDSGGHDINKLIPYDSVSDAEEAINSGEISVYPGMLLNVKKNEKYLLYSVQVKNGRYIVEPVDTYGESSIWEDDN